MAVFSNILFCFTGIEPSLLKDDLLKKLGKLGGEYSPHLTKAVTHLVAGRIINSPKYLMARKMKIPTLLPSFINDCWTRSHLGSIDLRQMEVLHSVPTFYGCIISVTGASIEERQKMAQLISTNGGIFAPDMHSTCTHLIVAPIAAYASKRASPKLAYARKWEIPLVSPDWLYDATLKQTCLDHLPFKVDIIASQECGSLTATATTTMGLGHTQTFLYDDLTVEEINAVSLPPYLEGLHIYVGNQQAPDRLLILKKLILNAGGTRYADLYDKSLITHYIVHNQTLTPKEMELLRSFEDRPPPIMVHDQWLFACFYSKKQFQIDPFVIQFDSVFGSFRDNTLQSRLGQATIDYMPDDGNTGIEMPVKAKSTIWSLRSVSSQTRLETTTDLNSRHDYHSQHSHHHQQQQQQLKLSQQQQQQQQYKHQQLQPQQQQQLPQQQLPQQQLPQQQLPIFAGLKFKLLFDHEPFKRTKVLDLIEKNGGSVIAENDEDDFDHLIGPIIIQENVKCLNEVWIEACCKSLSCLTAENSLMMYYSSICTLNQLQPDLFASYRISITGFVGIERDYYAKLTSALGAGYTENLSKKNTHLIVGISSGPKFEFAISTGIKCLEAAWLVDSALAGRPIDEDNYLVQSEEKDKLLEIQREATNNNNILKAQQQKDQPLSRRLKLEEKNDVDKENRYNHHVNIQTPVASISIKRPFPLKVETPIRDEIIKRVKDVAATLTPTGLTQDETLLPLLLPKTNPKILNGLIFAISPRLWHKREEMHELATEMGGTFVWTYDTSCTHYLHQGNMEEELFKEFKTVKQHGKWIISPHWLLACKEAGKKLAESDYSHTFNPNSLFKKTDSSNLSNNIITIGESSLPLSPPPNSLLPTLAVEPTSPIDFNAIIAADKKSNKPIITYDLGPIKKSALIVVDRPKFAAFTSLTPDQKNTFPEILSTFGFNIIASNNWNSSTTHMIIGVLSKSEKFLCACAAGIWVLHPSFVDSCNTAGKIIDERHYEWQASMANAPTDELAKVPRYWREFREQKGKKAFHGLRILLVADQKRLASLMSILVAGDAQVYLLDEDYNVEALTHVLISSAQIKSKIPIEHAQALSGKFHNIEFIAEHLINFDKNTFTL